MNLSRNSKNQEILENLEVREKLEKGDVIVIEIADTKNPDYKSLFLAQYVEGGGSQINNAQSALLGWTRQLERCVSNAATNQVENIKSGDSLNEKFNMDFAIQINDTHTPDENFNHAPRATSDGELLVDANTGKEVYRHKTLTTRDTIKHNFIKTVLSSDYKEGNPVSKESILSNAKV